MTARASHEGARSSRADTRRGSARSRTNRAKPLLPVAGRPIVDWILDKIAEVDDVDEVHLVTNARFAPDFERWAQGPRARPRRRHDVERGPPRRDRRHRLRRRPRGVGGRGPARHRRRQPLRLQPRRLRRLLARQGRQRDRRLRASGTASSSASTASSSSTATTESSASRRSRSGPSRTSSRSRRTSTTARTSRCCARTSPRAIRPTSPATSSPGSTRARRSTATASAASGWTSATGRSCSRRTTATAAARACRNGTNTRSIRPFGLFTERADRAHDGLMVVRLLAIGMIAMLGLARGPAGLERLLAQSRHSGVTCGDVASPHARAAAAAALPRVRTQRRRGLRRLPRGAAADRAAALRALRQPDRVAGPPLRRMLRPPRLAFETARAAVAYDERVRAIVAGWKEHGLRRLAATAADVVVAAIPRPRRRRADVRSRRTATRLLERGHHPGRAPRARARRALGAAGRSTCSRARGPAPRQRGASLAERRRNVRGAFAAKAERRRARSASSTTSTRPARPPRRARPRSARAGARQVQVVTFARALRLR